MSLLYATFDPASIGASLALSNGLATVTTTADGLDAHRMVRGTRPQAVWPAYAEGLCWGSAALGGAYFGAVTASAGLDKYVGEDAYGFGLKLDTGAVYSNGAVVDTFSPVVGLFYGRQYGTYALYNGSLDEWRITNGVARYDADFTQDGPFV